MQNKISVVIPVYNEAGNIGAFNERNNRSY